MKLITLALSLYMSTSYAGPTSLPTHSCVRNPVKVIEEVVLSKKPNLRYQGYAGYCYAFSALVLLDHHFCLHNECGKYDEFSVLDLLQQKEMGHIREGGIAGVQLKLLEQNDFMLAKESCTPYKRISGHPIDFFSIIKNTFREGATIDDELFEYLAFSLDRSDFFAGITPEEIRSSYKVQERTKRPGVDYIVSDLLKYNLNKCADKRIQLPAYQVHSLKDPSLEEFNQKITEVLSSDRPLVVNYQVSGGGHSVALVSKKVIKCTDDKERVFYELSNSASRVPEWVEDQTLYRAARQKLQRGLGLHWITDPQ